MKTLRNCLTGAGLGRLLFAAGCLFNAAWLYAQPTVVSTVPANMATGVSPVAPVVITFSTAMDTNATTAEFLAGISYPPVSLTMTVTWSPDQSRMTNTPTPTFPINTMIMWSVDGQDTL